MQLSDTPEEAAWRAEVRAFLQAELPLSLRRAIDMVKARVRRPPLASGPVRENASAGLGDIDLVILRAQLRQALSSLGPHHREAVVETVLRDRPHADVAAELGVTPGTLRTRVHYALRRLRHLLETEDTAETALPCCC